jgi:hypothetical protein
MQIGEKIVSSKNHNEKTCISTCRRLKLDPYQTYSHAIPFLVIYPKEYISGYNRDHSYACL